MAGALPEDEPASAMSIKERNAAPPRESRIPQLLDLYPRVIAVLMIVLGLRHWAVILGVVKGGGGMFENMSTPWQMATMHLAVVDLVAAVGLWMRVSWGNVVWVYAALSEIALHTIFIRTFGHDFLIVTFHFVTLSGFVALTILSRRVKSA